MTERALKLYEFKYEEDGQTVKAPGVSETTIKVCSLFYAAESEEDVWAVTASLRADPERRFKAIGQVLELVTVVSASVTVSESPNG